MTVEDIGLDGTLDGTCIIDATAIECIDICIVDLPMYVAVDRLLAGSCRFHKMSAADVTFGIVGHFCGIGVICTSQIESLEFTAGH